MEDERWLGAENARVSLGPLYLRANVWAVSYYGKNFIITYMEQNNLPELNIAARVYSFTMCAGKYKAHTIAALTQYQNLMDERQKTSTC